jgi:AcrR family transcriptional regulator
MKPRVDHEARRRAVAKATWAVIRRKGLDRTGIRDVADELGSTASVVTHYFRTRDELIRFACNEVFASYRRHLRDESREVAGLGRLERMLLDGLPIEPGRDRGWEVWLAFLGHAIGRPAMIREEATRQAELRDLLVAELGRLSARGDIAADVDVALEADLLTAVIDGLGIGRVIQPERYDRARVIALLRTHLERRLGRPVEP